MHVAVVNHETDCADWTGDVDCNAPRSLSCLFLDQMREQTLRPVGHLRIMLAALRPTLDGLLRIIPILLDDAHYTLGHVSAFRVSLVSKWSSISQLQRK